MRILVDMDGVICNWDSAYDRELDAAGEAAARIPRTPDRLAFNLNEGRSAEEKRIIRDIMRKPGFYERLTPIPGAKVALKWMLEQGHDVRIVTSPWASNPTCASDKLNWVRRHLGESWSVRTILTNDKTLVRGDILIDDKPEITGSLEPEWTHILFSQPYNLSVNRPRIDTWLDGEWKEVIGTYAWSFDMVGAFE